MVTIQTLYMKRL